MKNNNLVFENGELKPKYTIKEKYTDIVVARVADIEDALRIKDGRKDLIIINEANKEELKF